MSNFKVIFSHPWLLFLLIPATAIALWPYFRLSKKYRRTRNRVVSLVLHLIIVILSISVITGAVFEYEKPNVTNEVLLLVDMSHSSRSSEENKNEFVKTVLDESGNAFQVGIITFGRDQIYAAPLSANTDRAYGQYLDADRPDGSATDIISALQFAKSKFSNPESGKIVLISDGVETDGDALSSIASIISGGTRVDTVFFPDEKFDEVQIISVEAPDYNILVNETVEIGVTIQSSFTSSAGANCTITMYDNDEPDQSVPISLSPGITTVYLKHKFLTPLTHKVYFKLECDGDTLEQNNTFFMYLYLEVYDRVLIVQREDEASRLVELINDDYNIEVVNISEVPDTLAGLREYDQVILMNIASADMPEGFGAILYSYVNEAGGGLFTVGGTKIDDKTGDTVANAYNRADMAGTLYQRLLPVDCVDYTPPLGLIVIVDRSGSMNLEVEYGNSALDMAKEGAISCVEGLTDRDWCGIVALESDSATELPLTPVTQKMKILNAINGITGGGGTIYASAIERAGRALQACKDVEKKHIIFVSDGEPGDNASVYEPLIKSYYENAGITLTYLLINGDTTSKKTVGKNMADLGGGRFYDIKNISDISYYMREDLNVPEIKEVVYETFKPTVKEHTQAVKGIKDADIPTLDGFYGTKARKDASVVLAGPYGVPVYAQWNYGEGRVGSFMCDLTGEWSEEFLTAEIVQDGESVNVGLLFLKNVINGLFPSKSIRAREIEAQIEADNYSKQVNIKTALEEGQTVGITVTDPLNQTGDVIIAEPSGSYYQCAFFVSEPGIYEIKVQKRDADGNPTGGPEYFYEAFSYSAEYDVFFNEEDCVLFLKRLAKDGKGEVITLNSELDTPKAYALAAQQILAKFDITLSRSVNPKIAFIITAIILFLIDIAVRKFKFKWPWEIVRDHKAKKAFASPKNQKRRPL